MRVSIVHLRVILHYEIVNVAVRSHHFESVQGSILLKTQQP